VLIYLYIVSRTPRAAHSLLLTFQNHSILDSQPQPCTDPHAERQRQALVGYDNLPDSAERQYLRLSVHASAHTPALRHGENELQTLLNRFPTATACRDGRATALKLCRAQVDSMDLFRIREDPLASGRPLLQPVFTDILTVLVRTARLHPEDGPEGFDSPEQVVDVVARVFGSDVEKIVWCAWCSSGWVMSIIYWPHTPRLGHLPEE